MNNKEKLYLVKLARGAANTPEQMQSYQRLNPPTPGSRRYRELPKAERQSILSARDKQQARGLAGSNALTNTQSFLSNRPKERSYQMRNQPTAKGGLSNIPPRPDAHPFSSGDTRNHRFRDGFNEMYRKQQNLPILPSPLEPGSTNPFHSMYRR